MPRSSYRTRQTKKTTLLRQRTDAGKPLEASTAGQIMNDLALWHVHAPAARDVLAAIDIHQQTGASFWDAVIVRGAQLPDSLYSEDLNPGHAYAGVRVSNPFLRWRSLRNSPMRLVRPADGRADERQACRDRKSRPVTAGDRYLAGVPHAIGLLLITLDGDKVSPLPRLHYSRLPPFRLPRPFP